MKHITVSRMDNSLFPYQGWPSVCRDCNGDILVVASGFRRAHVCPFGKTVMYKSTDGGETFSLPMIVNDSPLDDRDAGVICTGGENLLVTSFRHPADLYVNDFRECIRNDAGEAGAGLLATFDEIPENERHGGSYIFLSKNNGVSFYKTVQIPVSAPHGPIMLKNGNLLYLGQEMYSSNLPTPEKKSAVACYGSTDGGETWQRLGGCVKAEGLEEANFCEPHCVELDDGRLLGFLRVEGKGVEGCTFTMYTTISEDGGKNWSVPEPTGIDGAPPFLMKHSSGKIILTYTRRTKPYSIRALILDEKGKVISDEITVDDNSDSSDMGYPASVELDDGRILTVYYMHARRPDGEFDKFCSILATVWDLDEFADAIK